MSLRHAKEYAEDALAALEAAFELPVWEELYDVGDMAADVQETIGRAATLVRDAVDRLP
jgi:hypothetical protein